MIIPVEGDSIRPLQGHELFLFQFPLVTTHGNCEIDKLQL